MTALASLLAAIGLTDIVCGGRTAAGTARARLVAVIAAAAAGPAVAVLALGARPGQAALLGTLVGATTAAWLGLRRASRHGAALAALAAGVIAALLGHRLLGPDAALHRLPATLDALPGLPPDTPPALPLLVASIAIFLGPSANAVVRSVLSMASGEPALERSEGKLRGGRFIGVLERGLIFGLALAGEPTAAALVISAKSIIRFPELSARSQAGEGDDAARLNDADEVTEYFLLGSLTSWALALAPAALVLALGRAA